MKDLFIVCILIVAFVGMVVFEFICKSDKFKGIIKREGDSDE